MKFFAMDISEPLQEMSDGNQFDPVMTILFSTLTRVVPMFEVNSWYIAALIVDYW